MNGADVLKSYLVSLGFGIDDPSFAKFKKTLDDSSKYVEGSTSGMTKNYVKAGGIIASVFASIGIATISLLDKIAQADLGYQKFATSMFMSKQAAKELKIATDALGESMQDIAWNPELRQRYFELMRQERQMETPKDAEKQLKYLRDIRFEFTRLKIEATYGMQWIGYHLFKNLRGPLAGFHNGMKGLNDWISQKMPEWSERVARWVTIFLNVGGSALRLFKDVFNAAKKVITALPHWKEGLVALGLTLGLIFAPITTAIGILLLLIDDFYGYLDGRTSSATLAPIWDQLLKKIDLIKWNLLLAGRMIDKFVDGSDKSYSQIWDDTKAEWRKSLQERYGDRYRDYDENGDLIPNKSDMQAARKSGVPLSWTQMINGNSWREGDRSFLNSFLDNLRYGMHNYNSITGSAMQPAFAGGPGSISADTHITVGDVQVNVTQPNASAKEIGNEVKKSVSDALDGKLKRNMRNFTGIY